MTPEAPPPQPLLVTPGEPAGIGPDVLLAAAGRGDCSDLIAVAAPDLLRQRAARLGLPIEIVPCTPQATPPAAAGALRVWPVALPAPVQTGVCNPANAAYVLDCLRLAADACQRGMAAAMVTGPVQKSVIIEAGHRFSGHTEFLAELAGAPLPVMMLVAPHARPQPLRVALATTHLPLREVADRIREPLLGQVLDILHHDLQRRFGIDAPRIKVCGLNPHAGESGHLGREEIDIIAPAVAGARRRGIDAIGPLPADTLLTPAHLGDADAVLALFHDQGLPVLKYAGFGTAVNITLGLPFLRLSVDHGTALDRAGSGSADPGSLIAALAMARQMVAQSARREAQHGTADGRDPMRR